MDDLFRSRGDFEETTDAAADLLGISPAIVEKDYWVSQVLRTLAEKFPEDFVFKGGTSLSKCFNLIQRFSEDIDVLVLPGSRGRTARDTQMKSMGEDAAKSIGDASPRRSGGGGINRTYYLTYPRKRNASWLRPTIDLEMGIRGGPDPSERRQLEPLLRTALHSTGVKTDDYPDLAQFDLSALHPGRTLVEKLALVNEEADRCEREPSREFPVAMGRHLYDIFMLTGNETVLRFLNDRDQFLDVVHDCERVSREYFNADYARPSDGYGMGSAFRPSDRLGSQLRAALASAEDLYFGDDPYPTWNAVLDRVRTYSEFF